MSDSGEIQKKWRDSGSLRYLACGLDVTTKQVTRYWDNGWIAGSYRTAKGHRRIRYTDDTVNQVSMAVNAAKATNKAIRYHIESITYCGTRIPVKGCTNRQNLYKRALKTGLNHQDARKVADTPRGLNPAPCKTDLDWECLLAIEGTSRAEVAERMNILSYVPAAYLYQARDHAEFLARSRDARARFLSEIEGSAGWDGFPRSSPEGKERRQKIRDLLDPLFHQPDRESFLTAFNNFAELDTRIMNHTEPAYRAAQKMAADWKPEDILLEIAVLSLKRSERAPSAAALAQALGISRPALYRRHGKKVIQVTLASVRNDPLSIRTTRRDRKKSNSLATERDQ